MQLYSIDQLSQITGLNKILIRTWENRYDFLIPKRTSTNIRLYDDKMLTKSIKYAILVDAGYKISKLVTYNLQEINNLVKETLEETQDHNTKHKIYIAKFIESAIYFDQELFSKAYKSCIEEIGIIKFYKNILIPTMNQIGILFLNSKITPANEHFLSENIRIKISYEIEQTKTSVKKEQKPWVLFMPEYEYHDIGLLFTYLMLKKKNQRVIYLGQNTPIESLIKFNEDHNLLCFLNTKKAQIKLKDLILFLNNNFKKSMIYIATREKIFSSTTKNIQIIQKLEDLEKILKKI